MLNRYREALYALALEVLAQTQFRRHQAKLEELDDKILDDNVSFKIFCRYQNGLAFCSSLEIIGLAFHPSEFRTHALVFLYD